MRADLGVAEALALQGLHIGRLCGPVIVGNEMRARGRAVPVAIELRGDVLQEGLVVARIADQHDVGEAGLAEAATCRVEQAFEGRVGNRDRSGVAHMAGRRRDGALRNIGQHGSHQRVAQLAGDLAGQRLHPYIVLAQRHMRAVLLGAADGHDDGGRAGLQRIAHFSPSEIFEIDAARPDLCESAHACDTAQEQNQGEHHTHRHTIMSRDRAGMKPPHGRASMGETHRSTEQSGRTAPRFTCPTTVKERPHFRRPRRSG